MPLRTSNGIAFTVLAPVPALRTGIEVRVYDRLSPATPLDVLPRTRARRWLDQLNDPGTGSFEIAESDPKLKANPALLTYGNIVRLYLDGVVRFAFAIEHVERTKASEGEDADRWLKVSGRGALALLEGALVYLTTGLTGSAERAFTAQKAGAIMSTLVAEAQARGGLEGVTLGFTATDDSVGAPFEETLDLSERAGSDLLQVAQRHAELAVDVAMRPTLVLDYFNSRGIDRSIQTPNAAPVVLRIAHNVAEASFASEGVIKNTLLIEGPAGWQERQDAGSVTTYGRREGYLSLGTAGTADQIGRSADAALRENAKPRDAITLRVEDLEGHRPYVDFDVGDWVLAPSPTGGLAKYRVRAISVAEDADGRPTFVPELSTVQREFEERFQRWLKAMSNGTLGGYAAEIASPAADAAAVDQKVDQHAATVLHPDELRDLLDVNVTGVVDGQLLGYDGPSAKWKPKTVAGAGGPSDQPLGRASTAAAPGASDDEFDDGVRAAAWLEAIPTPTDPGDFLEKYGRQTYRHKAAPGATRRLHALVKPLTLAVGDYLEAAIEFTRRADYFGPGLVLSNGATFGSGSQIVAWIHWVGAYRVRLNGWSNWNANDADGTQVDLVAAYDLIFVRLKYEAANTWGLYVSADGVEWHTVQTNYAKTLTPTHAGLVAVHWDTLAPVAAWMSWHYFRLNPAND